MAYICWLAWLVKSVVRAGNTYATILHMDIEVPAGRYVVAVSGGVDSVVLLDLLAGKPDVRLTVAHFDHGIREDADEDRKLVAALAKQYGVPFVYHRGRLGKHASEARARQARYEFLHHVRRATGSRAIITAHHQDDVLETALLNLLRGTGNRGLAALKSTDIVRRPLLHVPKASLLRYARIHDLTWREDSTNADERYLRNYVRRRLLPRFNASARAGLLDIIRTADETQGSLDTQVINYLHIQPASTELDRHAFIGLPHAVAREVLSVWLRQQTGAEITTKLLERLVVAAKTARPGSRTDIDAGHWLVVTTDRLALQVRER